MAAELYVLQTGWDNEITGWGTLNDVLGAPDVVGAWAPTNKLYGTSGPGPAEFSSLGTGDVILDLNGRTLTLAGNIAIGDKLIIMDSSGSKGKIISNSLDPAICPCRGGSHPSVMYSDFLFVYLTKNPDFFAF